MDSIKDSINNFLDEYIFIEEVKSRISKYGNNLVDYINVFIKY